MASNSILTLALIILVNSLMKIDAQCPVPTTKPDFDVTRYYGDWYNVWGKVDFQRPGSKCSKANYSDMGEGKVRVKNDGFYANETFQEVCGFATIPDPTNPGTLSVQFPFTGSPAAPYYVLDTDYENWASVFSCVDGRPSENSWILFRSTQLDLDTLTLALEPYLRNEIDISGFYEFPQPEDCIYEPATPDPSCL